MRKRIPIGSTRSIGGRRLSLRRYVGNRVEWFDASTKEIVYTQLDYQTDRRSPKWNTFWINDKTGTVIGHVTRERIRTLAQNTGLSLEETKTIVMEGR